MNRRGNPATLRAAQPGNRNAVKSGIYSRRVRAERAEEIRAAAAGVSTLALARAALVDEVARLGGLREGLDEDIVAWGPSTRAGALRGQVSQRSSVSKQLEKLRVTWAMGESVDGDDIADRGSQDGSAGSLREDLLAALVQRDLLDHDLEARGVSTPSGGERRHVGARLQVCRDLVRLADRIRTEARRAVRSGVAPMSVWEVTCEVAFDASQPPRDVIGAVEHLLTHPAPRVRSPELERLEEEVRGMSLPEIDAAIVELEAAENERRATARPAADVAADTDDEPEPSEAPGTDVITRCLEILQRIGNGLDERASGPDRIRAAKLREQHLAATIPRDLLQEEIDSLSPEEIEEELEQLLAEDG